MLRTVQATRYVTPLREGGSLPAIVEAEDDGLYVLKFRGAGQGVLALVAELLAGEIGRQLGLNVPELVFVQVNEALGRNEPDEEICDLLRASVGLNLGMDYLPGSLTFDPVADTSAVDSLLASRVVWFDSFVTNVDRTARNPNLLIWHKALQLIDHGAALYFHHNWRDLHRMALTAFPPVRQHILLPWATDLPQADEVSKPLLTPAFFAGLLETVPDDWLTPAPSAETPAQKRAAYIEYLTMRLAASSTFVEEGIRAQSECL